MVCLSQNRELHFDAVTSYRCHIRGISPKNPTNLFYTMGNYNLVPALTLNLFHFLLIMYSSSKSLSSSTSIQEIMPRFMWVTSRKLPAGTLTFVPHSTAGWGTFVINLEKPVGSNSFKHNVYNGCLHHNVFFFHVVSVWAEYTEKKDVERRKGGNRRKREAFLFTISLPWH